MGKRKAWAVVWTVYFASIVVAMNQFKVPPVMGALLQQLHVGMSEAGWLMSLFAVAGVILAIPAAVILNQFGPKFSGLLGLGFSVVGCLLGAMANDATVLLISRAVEGVGVGLVGVISPAMIAMYFDHREMGLPMGIWSTWVPVGATLAFNLAVPLESSFGWQGNWWLGAILGVIAFILYGAVVSKPTPVKITESQSQSEQIFANHIQEEDEKRISYRVGFKTPGIWLLALSVFAFMFCNFIFTTWAPTYLSTVLGMSSAKANLDTSLMFVWAIPAGVFCGWLLTRLKNHKAFLVGEMAFAAVVYLFTYSIAQSTIMVYVAVLGIVTMFFTTTVFTIAPRIMPHPTLAGLGMGMSILAQNLASLIGPPIAGSFISSGHWKIVNYLDFSVLCVGVVSAAMLFLVGKTASAVKRHALRYGNGGSE